MGLLQTHTFLQAERQRLKALRFSLMYSQAVPGAEYAFHEAEAHFQVVTNQLQEVESHLLRVLLHLLTQLPSCSECERPATSHLKNGPFFCANHGQEHPTAQSVPWEADLRTLGLA